jgi:hypothetical protein
MQRRLLYGMLQVMQHRKTVNFVGSTVAEIAPFLRARSTERRALSDLVGEELDSESDVLRALMKVGIRAVRDRQLEEGYAAVASSYGDEDREWAESSTRAATQRWQDE